MAVTKILVLIAVVFAASLSACADRPPRGSTEYVSEQKVARDVQEKLDSMSDLGPPGAIRVEVRDKAVWLTGTVDTGIEKWRAESAAMQVPGVIRVINSINVEHK